MHNGYHLIRAQYILTEHCINGFSQLLISNTSSLMQNMETMKLTSKKEVKTKERRPLASADPSLTSFFSSTQENKISLLPKLVSVEFLHLQSRILSNPKDNALEENSIHEFGKLV